MKSAENRKCASCSSGEHDFKNDKIRKKAHLLLQKWAPLEQVDGLFLSVWSGVLVHDEWDAALKLRGGFVDQCGVQPAELGSAGVSPGLLRKCERTSGGCGCESAG